MKPYLLVPVKLEGLEEVAKSLLAETPVQDTVGTIIKTNISNPEDYIQINGTNKIIARQETHKGLTWKDTHYALAENGLYIPSPPLFIGHFLNILSAFEGKTKLYNASGKQLPRDEVEDLAKYLTSGHRGGCWTWLDASFPKGSGHNKLDFETDHRVIIKGKNKKIEGVRKTLELCIAEDCFVDLEFNSQGLAIRKSANQSYQQYKNIKFWYPRKDAVARFDADSDRAGLDCDRLPSYSIQALGVFGCAEGTREK